MVAWGNSKKPVRDETPYARRNVELKLPGVVFIADPYNITDTQFDLLLNKATTGLYIPRVCKFYGYSRDELTILYNSLIASLFNYAIEMWGLHLMLNNIPESIILT